MSNRHLDYYYRYVLEHAAGVGAPHLWDQLLVRIETGGFLARQVEHFGDFERTSRDLERHALPELIRRGDWELFLHLALVAANLRGLSDELDDPTILRIFVRDGRLSLAEKLVSQLSNPLRRARARAVLAATQPASAEAFGRLVEGVRSDLDLELHRDAAQRDPQAAAAWCDALVAIAECIGPELRARLPVWIAELVARDLRDGRNEGLSDRVWLALAESFLRRGEYEVDALWFALGEIRDPVALLGVLSDCLPANPPTDPWPFLNRLRSFASVGVDLAWMPAVALLRGQARSPRGTDSEVLSAYWQRAVAELGPPPWSERLVEAGWHLWQRLPEDLYAAVLLESGDPTVSAALTVSRLEASPTAVNVVRALGAIEAITEGASRLHWALRYLLALPRTSRRELEAQAAVVVRYLARVRWVAPAEDLCRYLDLMAEVYPGHLRAELENVLWTPNGNAATLRYVAGRSTHAAVSEELSRRAEDYAAMAGATAAEGFELRREVLVILAARRCAAEQSIEPLERAAERLLPEEEDELRREAGRRLAEVGRADLALRAAAGLRSHRLALLTRLEVAPEASRLGLSELYAAVATSPGVTDERLALSALQELPNDPGSLARDHLEGMSSKGRQVLALVDLARHALTYQRRVFEHRLQDPLAAILPLKRALGVVESEGWLAALIPELVAVGSRLGEAQAVAEIQEGFERLVGHTVVAWKLRRTVLLQLIAGIGPALSVDGSPLSPARLRRALRLIEWIGRLPAAVDGPGQPHLRQDWHRILPWLRAMEEHLGVRSDGRLERLRTKWTWLTADQRTVVDLCFSPAAGLLGAAEISAAAVSPEAIRVHACLRLVRAPEGEVAALVTLLPPGHARDELVQELLRFAPRGSLPIGEAAHLAVAADPATRPRLKQWLWLRYRRHPATPRQPVWPAPLLWSIAESVLDLDDPSTAPLRRRTWQSPREETLPALARAAVSALASGGKRGCEQGLRLFLNLYLAPALGTAGDDSVRDRLVAVERAERRSLQLAPSRSLPVAESASPAGGSAMTKSACAR